MAKNLWWAVVVVAAALIQTTWLDAIQLQGVLPDLPLLLVIYFAIAEGEERAMFTGVLGGLYQDVAGNSVLGHHVLCLVVVGFMAGRIARRLVLDHPVVKVGLVMMGSLAHGILYTTIEYVQTPGKSAIHIIMTNVVPGAFYTALFTPVVFFLLARSFSRHDSAQGGAA